MGCDAPYRGDEYRRLLATARRLGAWARDHGHTLVELAIAWVLSHPALTVCLCGAKSPAQVDEHVRAAGWQLTPEDCAAVERLLSA